MRITGITNYNIQSQNFRGLWGKTSLKTDIDNVLFIPKISEIKYYYPFEDEKPEDIKKIIESRKKAEIIEDDGFERYKVNDCKLGKKLPFNELQYDSYMQISHNMRQDKMITTIHNHVKNKYLNEIPGSRQVHAYNPHISL